MERGVQVGTSRCDVRAACSGATSSNARVARIFVPPATTRAGTAQRAIPTITLNTYAAVAATADGMPTETGSYAPKWPGNLPAEQEHQGSQEPDTPLSASTELPDEAQNLLVGSLPLPGATL